MVFKKLKALNIESSEIQKGIQKIAKSIKIEDKLKELVKGIAHEKKFIISQLPQDLDYIIKCRKEFTQYIYAKIHDFNKQSNAISLGINTKNYRLKTSNPEAIWVVLA